MRKPAFFLILPFLTGAWAPPAAPSNHIVMPLFSRVFDFRTADAFIAQPLQRDQQQVLLEFLQKGETFDTWTRLVTARGFRGLGASPLSTRDIATRLFDPKGCVKAGGVTVGIEEPVAGPLKRTIVIISCGRSPGDAYAGDKAGGGEQDVMYLFRDDAHIYTLQYAMRGASFDTPPIDLPKAATILNEQFGPVLLCANVDQPGCKETMIVSALNGGK